jgi:hypothetical protein
MKFQEMIVVKKWWPVVELYGQSVLIPSGTQGQGMHINVCWDVTKGHLRLRLLVQMQYLIQTAQQHDWAIWIAGA